MTPRRTARLTLCIALIAAFVSFGICCTNMEWQCLSGDCIAMDELCDGNPDCSDESDEKPAACIQQSCPSFAFRCAYGACVSGTAECNGIKECADNSDEISPMCHTDDLKQRISTCNAEQFQCESNECIGQDNACDGYSDCQDQSDETVEACASTNCASFAFRCGYGACISADKKCDGEPDCRDGSDETFNLCGTTPTVKPPPIQTTTPISRGSTKRPPPTRTTTPKPVGCIAPNIANSQVVYEVDNTTVVEPGEDVPELTSIIYKCKRGFSREGPQFNLCYNGVWRSDHLPVCLKYCKPNVFNSVTFRAQCTREGQTLPCDDRIKPGTVAKILCQVKYRKPDLVRTEDLKCEDDGEWDYGPSRCEQVCGEEPVKSTKFSVGGEHTVITDVPWHVGIYERLNLVRYKHNCGGTIISAKVVISAAHCFWDTANEKAYDKSLYSVGAGKYYRDYDRYEENAVFQNISLLLIPSDFNGEIKSYRADIAVLVLNNFLKFSPFVAPVCINWEWGEGKSIRSNTDGRISGWGIDESGGYSEELRTVVLPATSYAECTNKVGPKLATAVTRDKFCTLNEYGSVVCRGDSGGGFTVAKMGRDGITRHFLWGVVSSGVPDGRNCQQYDFVTYTNIQHYESMIREVQNSNRPT